MRPLPLAMCADDGRVRIDEDLELIFSRFGKILSCEVIRDKKTGDSLQYAFIEFENRKDCEQAYFKMQGVLIDDHRIHVDFSQSVRAASASRPHHDAGSAPPRLLTGSPRSRSSPTAGERRRTRGAPPRPGASVAPPVSRSGGSTRRETIEAGHVTTTWCSTRPSSARDALEKATAAGTTEGVHGAGAPTALADPTARTDLQPQRRTTDVSTGGQQATRDAVTTTVTIEGEVVDSPCISSPADAGPSPPLGHVTRPCCGILRIRGGAPGGESSRLRCRVVASHERMAMELHTALSHIRYWGRRQNL